MLDTMDSLELKFYKQLSLNERINDKQGQLIHLAKVSAYDHMELPDYANIFPKRVRTILRKLTSDNAVKPY